MTFLKEARVLDAKRGYISASAFNLRMKPEVLWAAAKVIAGYFGKFKIDVIHGISHGGNYLATAVALAMAVSGCTPHAKIKTFRLRGKRFIAGKLGRLLLSGETGTVFAGINLSFVRPGERILLIDDICASGETGAEIITGLIKRGVKVAGFAVMFDKMFQGGLERIAQLGVKFILASESKT